MVNSKFKSVIVLATTIAVAISVGFGAPASALGITLTADKTVVQNGEGVTFTTNAPGLNYAAFFIGGEYWASGLVETTPNPFVWMMVAPCASVDVTYRVYSYSSDTADYTDAATAALFGEPYAASVDVEFAGDNTVGCDPTWGSGESADESADESAETLATTGSDASTVAGLTGVAGVAALAVAVAVSRRARRAQR